MSKKYGKYPILKISKISDIFELKNIGYISDIYHRYISPIYVVPTLRCSIAYCCVVLTGVFMHKKFNVK